MPKSDKISKQPSEVSRPKDLWSLPKEEAIARLMQKYDMSRERAEAFLRRDPTHVRRFSIEYVSKEELARTKEEIARSDERMTLGSSSRKDEPDDE